MSHTATCWALAQNDLRLELRMVLVLLADCHSPDIGTVATTARLAESAGVDLATMDALLAELVALGRIERSGGDLEADSLALGFEMEGRR